MLANGLQFWRIDKSMWQLDRSWWSCVMLEVLMSFRLRGLIIIERRWFEFNNEVRSPRRYVIVAHTLFFSVYMRFSSQAFS